MNLLTILQGDALEKLSQLEAGSAQCCVTSPPYFGLRDYGRKEQIGMEETPELYVARLVEVFREVWRVLRTDGTLWVNLGDSYSGSWGNYVAAGSTSAKALDKRRKDRYGTFKPAMADRSGTRGLKAKDLIGIPWMVAFALRTDGWYLRQEIIWHKPNPMPESVTDRCTKSHEQIFLLSKSPRYYFDQESIKEPIKDTSAARLIQDVENQKGSDRVPGKTNGAMKAVKFGGNKQCPDTRLQSGKEWTPKMAGGAPASQGHSGYFNADGSPRGGVMANKKSVWTVTTKGYKGAHFATFPPDLIRPCILAGCPKDGTVIDPFAGSGTTGKVAIENGRRAILIELNPEYIKLIEQRCQTNIGFGF